MEFEFYLFWLLNLIFLKTKKKKNSSPTDILCQAIFYVLFHFSMSTIMTLHNFRFFVSLSNIWPFSIHLFPCSAINSLIFHVPTPSGKWAIMVLRNILSFVALSSLWPFRIHLFTCSTIRFFNVFYVGGLSRFGRLWLSKTSCLFLF